MVQNVYKSVLDENEDLIWKNNGFIFLQFQKPQKVYYPFPFLKKQGYHYKLVPQEWLKVGVRGWGNTSLMK